MIIGLTTLAIQGMSMSLLNKPEEKIVLGSRMEGHITFGGKPVVGAKIERLIKWKDDVGEKDYTSTDKNGYFKLPKIEIVEKLSKFTQFSTSQDLIVHHNNVKFDIWTVGRMSKTEFSELGGIPINFRCDLTDEDEPLRINGSLIMTRCKWDEIKSINKE